jgi:hypothetical protein
VASQKRAGRPVAAGQILVVQCSQVRIGMSVGFEVS